LARGAPKADLGEEKRRNETVHTTTEIRRAKKKYSKGTARAFCFVICSVPIQNLS
jgi:hypothetical protein